MEQNNLTDPFKEIIDDFKDYLDNLITYNKLVFVKGSSELASYMMLLLLFFGISGFILLFFSFAFAEWFSAITGWSTGVGFLIVALFYLFFAGIIFFYRKRLIFNPVRGFFGRIFFDDYNPKNDEFTFDTNESQNENILLLRKKLSDNKENINEKVKVIEHNLTIKNILQEILGKAYSSIITTTNVARFVYTLISKFKGDKKSKKKVKKPLKTNEETNLET
ncbi:MAG: phage holin family protein [Lentimicrobiaceae bacterium]|jgi:hypothetical protein|nr:phage holin family protein [Lentimicrobiaceae bacterium]MCP4909672.1 phage holin family protein [Bacteroidota bacterium]MBT3454737.1 phage holin family protein [Lentimicrobiaceae bacterium]MBT3819659.1 phage holin family protein [Lentimicrobiaceae bacterium]MBT4061263.1 phage holin family protein [Lentimicrobiaceae bacterium]